VPVSGLQRQGAGVTPILQPAATEAEIVQPVSWSAGPRLGPSKEVLRLRLYAALAAIDFASVTVAFLAATLVWRGELLHHQGLDVLGLVVPVFLLLAFSSRAYGIEVLQTPKIGVFRSARSLLLAIAAAIGIIFYLKAGANFSRAVVAIGTAGSLFFVCAGRWLFGRWATRRYEGRFTREVLIVDGVPDYASHGDIVIFAEKAKISPATDDPHLLDRVGRLLKHCDRVVLACPPERRRAWAAMLKGHEIDVEMLIPELDELGPLAIGRLDGTSTLRVSSGPLGVRDRLLKRAFDLALTIPLLIMLLPVFIAVAVAIKLESPGAVFFRQPRVGLGNRMFVMLKFRSMRVESLDANADKLTQPGDSRLTRIGDFLRRTSLDELPQLINVLMGDMSIAGPRPHATGALAGEARYWEVDSRYWHRHAVKPGMTGLAQIRGYRGTTFERADLSNRLNADLEYLTGWSIWRDIAIVAATIGVLRHKNAF
jgi:exopolysaccharide biosynthesis polyprenyl glycosylphosphotransferase